MKDRPMQRGTARGFTLMELMVTLALAGVLAAIAVPNMRDFIRNNRLTAASNDLLRSMQISRSEAIKRQQFMATCASANPNDEDASCSNGAFSGWIVFEDRNNNWDRDVDEEIIDRKSVAEGVTVVSNNDGIVSYAPTGFANSTPGQTPTSRVVICDVRGSVQIGPSSTARAMLIENTGRARVTKDYTEVGTALTALGGCP